MVSGNSKFNNFQYWFAHIYINGVFAAPNVLVSQWIKNPAAIPDNVLQQQVKYVSDLVAVIAAKLVLFSFHSHLQFSLNPIPLPPLVSNYLERQYVLCYQHKLRKKKICIYIYVFD